MIRNASEISQGTAVEASLKDLLEKILLYLEKFIETQQDMELVEGCLKDYDGLINLIDIIKEIFNTLCNKIDLKLMKDTNSVKSLRNESDYDKLEQSVQKQEGEIRQHIRTEQQLRLYAESVQTKLDDSEFQRTELLETTKKLMTDLKRENEQLITKQRQLMDEISQMQTDSVSKDREIIQLNNQLEQQNKDLNSLKSILKKISEKVVRAQPNSSNASKLRTRQVSIYKDESCQLTQVPQSGIAGNEKQSRSDLLSVTQNGRRIITVQRDIIKQALTNQNLNVKKIVNRNLRSQSSQQQRVSLHNIPNKGRNNNTDSSNSCDKK